MSHISIDRSYTLDILKLENLIFHMLKIVLWVQPILLQKLYKYQTCNVYILYVI